MSTWIILGLEDLYLTGVAINIRTAHAVLLSVTFLILRPFGGLAIREIAQWSLRVHISVQLFSVLIGAAGAGLGIWLANYMERFGMAHVILGLVLVALVMIQIVLGVVHYRKYLVLKQRSIFGKLHTGLGRLIILMGIADGILGLVDSGTSLAGLILYSLASFISIAGYVFFLVRGHLNEKRSKRKGRSIIADTLSASFNSYERVREDKVDGDLDDIQMQGYGRAKMARRDMSSERMPLAGDISEKQYPSSIVVSDYENREEA